MAGLLAVTLVGVVLFCLARWLLPALRPAGHRHDLDAFHVAMGLAMVAMLLARPSRALSILTVVVAAAGLGWAVARLVRRSGRPAYLRLAAGSGAMLAMVLLPATAATAAAPHAGGHGHGSGATGRRARRTPAAGRADGRRRRADAGRRRLARGRSRTAWTPAATSRWRARWATCCVVML